MVWGKNKLYLIYKNYCNAYFYQVDWKKILTLVILYEDFIHLVNPSDISTWNKKTQEMFIITLL